MFFPAPWCMVQSAYFQAGRDKMSVGKSCNAQQPAGAQARNSGCARANNTLVAACHSRIGRVNTAQQGGQVRCALPECRERLVERYAPPTEQADCGMHGPSAPQ